jgi:rare lipoprotein A
MALAPRRARWIVGATLVMLTAACVPRRPAHAPAAPPPPPGWTQTGVASWYGPGYHGKRTASGERFDQNALTAAHGWLPFGTRVRVTLLSTGRSVTVRINDRLPRKDRVIDLSRAAAREIGLIGLGTGRVRVVAE